MIVVVVVALGNNITSPMPLYGVCAPAACFYELPSDLIDELIEYGG